MKVRQSVSVTSELGDQNNLALFNGENWVIWSSLAFRFGVSSFRDERSTCEHFKEMLPTSTPFHTNKNIHAHTTSAYHPPTSTHKRKSSVSAPNTHTHAPHLLRKMHYCSKSTYLCLVSTYEGGCLKICVCVFMCMATV